MATRQEMEDELWGVGTATDATLRPRAFAPLPAPSIPDDVRAYVTRTTQPARDELAEAQQRGAMLDFLSRQGAAYDNLARELIGRQRVQPSPSMRDVPAREVLARRAESERAAQRDPSSAEAQRLRLLLSATGADLSPEMLAALTPSDGEDAFRVAGMRLSSRDKQAALDAASAKAAAEAERKRLEAEAAEARRKQADAWEREKFNRTLGSREAEGAKNRVSAERRAALLAGNKQEADDLKQRLDLGKEFTDSGAPEFYSQYTRAKSILDKYKPGELPGYGFVEGRVPDRFMSDDAIAVRQGIGQMLASYQKMITGAGASDAERANLSRITGLLESNDERAVRMGVDMLREAMDNKVASLAAGYKPSVVEDYAARAPNFPARARPRRTTAQQGMPTGPDGNPTLDVPAKVRMRWPNGKVYEVPADKVQEAKSKFKATEVR